MDISFLMVDVGEHLLVNIEADKGEPEVLLGELGRPSVLEEVVESLAGQLV